MRTLLDDYQVHGPEGVIRHCIYSDAGVVHRVEWPLRAAVDVDALPHAPLDKYAFMPKHQARWRVCPAEMRDEWWLKATRYMGVDEHDAECTSAATARELDVVAMLDRHPHPNLCTFHGCRLEYNPDGGEAHVSGLVYERLHSTLAQQVTRQRTTFDAGSTPLPARDRVPVDPAAVMRDVRAALAHLRALGLVYVDITAANIMYRPPRDDTEGQWCLVDFAECYPPNTAFEYGVPGTPGWMDPKARVVDETVERSLGVLDEFMRTGVPPEPDDDDE